jgi:hypothetical protein
MPGTYEKSPGPNSVRKEGRGGHQVKEGLRNMPFMHSS